MQKNVVFLIIFLLISACAPINISDLTQTSTDDINITDQKRTKPSDEIDKEKEFSLLRLTLVENYVQNRGISNPDVIRAMKAVPRHHFVPEEYIDYAYRDQALPIGYGQTISQPYIVALMTELLNLKKDSKVLEIGTGSGYQAAVLEELGFVEVYTIEIVPELAERAAKALADNGYAEVHIKQGDGYYGWEEFAPFDAIIVTAAPDHLPSPLVNQLKDGGVLVIPIGPPGGYQTLWSFYREGDELKAHNHGGVIFVPFTGTGIETTP